MTEKRSMTVAHIRSRQQKTSGRNDEKMVARHKLTSFSSSWMPLKGSSQVRYLLILHNHESGDCHEPDERLLERSRVSELFHSADSRQAERSRVSSELLQSAGDCQSEHSRVLFEFLSCQAEDEGEIFQVLDDGFHLPEIHSWSSITGVFSFLASSILSSLAFHFARDSPRLTNNIILRCNHGIVDFLWVWITLSSCFSAKL